MDINNIQELFTSGGAEVSIIPVMAGDGVPKLSPDQLPDVLPVLALRNAVIFPGTIFPVTIGREKSLRLVEDAQKGNSFIATVPQINVGVEDPLSLTDLCEYGTVARIIKTFEMPDGTVSAVLQGFSRLHLDRLVAVEPYLVGEVSYLQDVEVDQNDTNIKIIADSLREKAATIMRSSAFAPREAVNALKSIEDFSFLVNFIASTVELDTFEEKVALLQWGNLADRAMALLSAMDKQVEILKIKQDINAKVKSEIDQQQREYYLNNQLRTIQEELGMDDDDDVARLKEAAKDKDWPQAVADQFEKELLKLDRFNPSSPEYAIQLNFLQFMVDLPWNHTSEDNLDLANAQKVLDEDHFGLENVKDRIIEYLAVLKLKGNLKSPILCLYGPPGVGKTSLGKSIARALGRKYVRISLGGMHDEAELRGHRKTYVGALPGRILNGIAKAGTANPRSAGSA